MNVGLKGTAKRNRMQNVSARREAFPPNKPASSESTSGSGELKRGSINCPFPHKSPRVRSWRVPSRRLKSSVSGPRRRSSRAIRWSTQNLIRTCFLPQPSAWACRSAMRWSLGDSVWDLLAARRARALGVGLLSGWLWAGRIGTGWRVPRVSRSRRSVTTSGRSRYPRGGIGTT